ncbi:hypothetical protein MRB53_028684 [Persea americana]|uniref:Uncharacterized protein n=1 Tax=Persea americana TaxID=3435 RepID=A0ACC2KGS5_PERAE|nr:hypothetical protein MRB53_028684 [Persea americana]
MLEEALTRVLLLGVMMGWSRWSPLGSEPSGEIRGDGCTGSLGSASDGDEVLRLGDEMGCVMEKGRDGWRWNSRDDGEIRKKKVNVSGDLYGRPGVCVQMEMRFCV